MHAAMATRTNRCVALLIPPILYMRTLRSEYRIAHAQLILSRQSSRPFNGVYSDINYNMTHNLTILVSLYNSGAPDIESNLTHH